MKHLIVRKAAGAYWLINPEQKSGYKAPIMINESAAEIIGYLKEGRTKTETAVILSEGDASIVSEIEKDIEELLKKVQDHFGFPE